MVWEVVFIVARVEEHSESKEHKITLSSIIPIAYLATFGAPVEQQQSEHCEYCTVFIAFISPWLSFFFFIWRWSRVWGAVIQCEHCWLHCCNLISALLRGDDEGWRGRPEFFPHVLAAFVAENFWYCLVLTWVKIKKTPVCAAPLDIFRHPSWRASIWCRARRQICDEVWHSLSLQGAQ